MTTISDLSRDLFEEILSRVPLTCLGAAKSTCKRWNALSKDQSFTKHSGTAAKEIMMIMIRGCRAHLMSVNLHGIHDHTPSIKQIGKLNQVEISNEVLHCDGLLLCATKNNSRLVVWNPHSGQNRWIQPKSDSFHTLDRFAIGYDSDNNHKVKVLRFYYWHNSFEYEIFDFKSNSWRVLDVTTNWKIHRRGVSLKGNTYFIAHERLKVEEGEFLCCFDFTKERFGQCLPLPFHSCLDDAVILSTVREEKIAVLFKRYNAYEIGIWITTKIEPNTVSWSNFLNFDMTLMSTQRFRFPSGNFFVHEKKKVAVIFDIDRKTYTYCKPYIVGEDGYYREVDFRESESWLLMCSYVPSSVQIQ